MELRKENSIESSGLDMTRWCDHFKGDSVEGLSLAQSTERHRPSP